MQYNQYFKLIETFSLLPHTPFPHLSLSYCTMFKIPTLVFPSQKFVHSNITSINHITFLHTVTLGPFLAAVLLGLHMRVKLILPVKAFIASIANKRPNPAMHHLVPR